MQNVCYWDTLYLYLNGKSYGKLYLYLKDKSCDLNNQWMVGPGAMASCM